MLVALAISSWARADVMNLNEFVPTHLEDATPVQEKVVNTQLGGAFEKDHQDQLTYRPDIRYGYDKRTQLEFQSTMKSGGDELRSGQTTAAAQYDVNESDNAFPVIAINPFVSFPTGKHSEGLDYGGKLILTSTLKGTTSRPETQIHVNYQLRHNASRRSGERAEEATYGLGLSRRLMDNLALVVDFMHFDEALTGQGKDYAEAGLHQQVHKGVYLSYGFGKGTSPGSPEWTGIFSFEVEI
ncbi:MAG: hypothetical protein ACJ76H_03520 [Bacteriovoracaceae bacterium]